MKLSESWLREWCNPSISTSELVETLTMAGLEVDAIEPVAGEFTGVVVAEITDTQPHPDAQKLRVCTVTDGAEQLQIVCGAPNARPGIRVPLAKVGARLPDGFKIKKAKLRGVESFGMLCARSELGVEGDSEGLWELPLHAEVGADLAGQMNLKDHVLDIDLTPNRADCLSVRGISREIALLNGLDYTDFVSCSDALDPTSERVFPVVIESAAGCPRYLSRTIENIDIQAPTPDWMVQKLERSGLRSIDAVVDITNYVLLELGQPMHAFDLDKLDGEIVVRQAVTGETIELLNEQQIDLSADVLLITDRSGPIAVAGVMGGNRTAVSTDTKNLLLESAFFSPTAIAGRARRFGLHTDASHRYERGVDWCLQRHAIERATELILSICGGQAGPVSEQKSASHLPQNPPVSLRKEQLQRLSGLEFSDVEIQQTLSRLGMNPQKHAQQSTWSTDAPSWRFDIAIEEDLIEEMIRVRGYDRLPERTPTVKVKIENQTETRLNNRLVSGHLVSRSFNEVISYSFIEPSKAAVYIDPDQQVAIQNPIASDMSVMRPSLLPGLVSTAEHNRKRQRPDLKLFEIGMCFKQAGQGDSDTSVVERDQFMQVAAVISGRRDSESWAHTDQPVDFFDIKGEAEALLNLSPGANIEFTASQDNGFYHPGQCAQIIKDGQLLGWVGKVHPQVAKQLDWQGDYFCLELDLHKLSIKQPPKFAELSRFPEVRRDLALLIDRDMEVKKLVAILKSVPDTSLYGVRIFDIYTGQGIDSNKKSVGLGLTFRDYSRTLQEEEVTAQVASILQALKTACGAIQR